MLPWRLIDGQTAVGSATLIAETLFALAPDSTVRTRDISGDGENNAGPAPKTAPARRVSGMTANALAVKGDLPLDHRVFATHVGERSAYFEAHVIQGPGAFVAHVWDYRDFEAAMTRKLQRERAPPMPGALAAPTQAPAQLQ